MRHGLSSRTHRLPRMAAASAAMAVICCMFLVSWLPARRGYLVVDERSLCFGEVWGTPEFKWELVLTNPSPKDVRVKRFLSGCRCVRIEPESLEIPAGTEAAVHVCLDLTRRDGEVATLREKNFEVEIVPKFAHRNVRASVWILHGTVKYPFVATPSALTFCGANELRRGVPYPVTSVRIDTMRSGLTISAHVPAEIGAVETTRVEENVYVVSFSPRHDLPTGSFSTQLQIEGINSSGGVASKTAIPITGTVAPLTVAIPSSLHLGRQVFGARINESVLFQAVGHGRPARVRSKCDHDGITVRVLEKNKRYSERIACEVSVDVDGMRHQEFTILFTAEYENGNVETLEIPGSYFVEAAIK